MRFPNGLPSMLFVLLPGLAAPLPAVARTLGDFNGDGCADLAIGVPEKDLDGLKDAGAVHVLYGLNVDGECSPAGLSEIRSQVWHRFSIGVPGEADRRERFGAALAAGDFDGDGFGDLAIGAPGFRRNRSDPGSGSVTVLYGTSQGLDSGGSQLWDRVSSGLTVRSQRHDQFGAALAAGDFDGDGCDDLAAGAPFKLPAESDFQGDPPGGAGEVNVIYGRLAPNARALCPGGLSADGNQLWHQGVPDVEGALEQGDYFGAALGSGDFNGDGIADLAVGVPGEDIGGFFGEDNAGAVQVIYGTDAGLDAEGNQIWHQDSVDEEGDEIVGAAERDDGFGSSVGSGDFDGDGCDDLVAGIPEEDLGTRSYRQNGGAVSVIYARFAPAGDVLCPGGLAAADNQIWHQDRPGVIGVVEEDDDFGRSHASGDFDGDGFTDLAIGVPGEELGSGFFDSDHAAGAVNVLYGSGAGLSVEDTQFWHQNSQGILGAREANDRFGRALASGDFNGDGLDDLAVGVPNEGLGSKKKSFAGAVNVIYGSCPPEGCGLASEGNQIWHEDRPGIAGSADRYDYFGSSLATGGVGGLPVVD